MTLLLIGMTVGGGQGDPVSPSHSLVGAEPNLAG
jgi:hypothetical protein